MERFKEGDRVYISTDPLGPRGTFKGYVFSSPGLCQVQWDSGVKDRCHVSELRSDQPRTASPTDDSAGTGT